MVDITNNDILETLQDLMQMTSGGFTRLEGRMDGLESKVSNIEGHMSNLETQVSAHTVELNKINNRLDSIEGKLDAHHNDIVDIFKILTKLEKKTKLSEKERYEAGLKLNELIAWAHQVANKLDIPLKVDL